MEPYHCGEVLEMQMEPTNETKYAEVVFKKEKVGHLPKEKTGKYAKNDILLLNVRPTVHL